MECGVLDIRVEFYDDPGLELTHGQVKLKKMSNLVEKNNKFLIERKRFVVVLLILNYRRGKFTKDDFDLARTVIEDWTVPIAIVVTHFEILFQE
jgi:hypothetical protein